MFFLFYLFLLLDYIFCCTEIMLKTDDDNIILGRTFDFHIEPHCLVKSFFKGVDLFSLDKFGNKNNFGKSKHNFVYFSVFQDGETDVITEGVNDSGLMVSTLWMEDTIYDDINQELKDDKKSIYYLSISALLLGLCKSVDEAKIFLKDKKIWAKKVLLNGKILLGKIHFVIYDKDRNSIVVEIKNGNCIFYENEVGVITNESWYNWQEKNLDNYLGLTNKTFLNLNSHKKSFHTRIAGNGLMGLPGDFTSSSRFVRSAIVKKFVEKDNTKQTIGIMDKLIGLVIQPKGIKLTYMQEKDPQFSWTRFVIIKDQKNEIWYIKFGDEINFTKYDLAEYFKKK